MPFLEIVASRPLSVRSRGIAGDSFLAICGRGPEWAMEEGFLRAGAGLAPYSLACSLQYIYIYSRY